MELVDFANGEVDIAIRYSAGRYRELEVHRLMRRSVIPVASQDDGNQSPLQSLQDLSHRILLHGPRLTPR